jgi:hypothetical protein
LDIRGFPGSLQGRRAHEADGGVVNVNFDWRPKNNVSNYASAEGTAMSDKSFRRHRQGRRRRRVLRAAIGNVAPMSLIGTSRQLVQCSDMSGVGGQTDSACDALIAAAADQMQVILPLFT